MPVSVLMPALSPTMTEGTISKWVKKEGDEIQSGDVIAEIETDKATMEVEAVDEGVLAKILVPEGTANVLVNKMIAVIAEEEDDAGAVDAFISSADGAPAAPAVETKKDEAPSSAPAPVATSAAPAVSASSVAPTPVAVSSSGRVAASPLARRLAGQYNIELSLIRGTGPNGRIVKADVESAKVNGVTSAAAAGSAVSGGALPTASGPNAQQLADMLGMEYEAIPNSNVRKTIASRLLESKVTVPHFYLTVECQIDRLLDVRAQINAEADGSYKLSVNDFVIKASAAALKKVPAANAAWTDANILKFEHADISVAVATDGGLITPIIKQAEDKSLREISASMKDLATRARAGKLQPTEYQGGTFSISNLGMYGIKNFSAIINPPQACILAVGAGVETPVIENGQVKAATVMSCTLSCDHRVVDGAVGAEFLAAFKDFIENPAKLFV